jgi:hypothetical protein
MGNYKRRVGQVVRRLTPGQARRIIDAVSARGVTIEQPEIRALTGGFNSQDINFYVIRKLAVRAGIIKAV